MNNLSITAGWELHVDLIEVLPRIFIARMECEDCGGPVFVIGISWLVVTASIALQSAH